MTPEAQWAQPVVPVDPAAEKAAADAREAEMAAKQSIADLNATNPSPPAGSPPAPATETNGEDGPKDTSKDESGAP